MPDEANRGDHGYVDAHDPKLCQAGYLPKPVCEAEHAAIRKRREYIRDNGKRDRTAYPFTGLALSGGGIRSASFGLGVLQALHVSSGIEGIDYLSTVSGGGYIGCSLTAATQESAAGHVLALLGLPVSHPFWKLPGFWFTAILAVVNIVFLVFWAFFKSISVSQFWQHGFARRRRPGHSAELRGGLVTVSQVLFFVTVTMAWLETQPFILSAMVRCVPDLTAGAAPCASAAFSDAAIGRILSGWVGTVTPWLCPT